MWEAAWSHRVFILLLLLILSPVLLSASPGLEPVLTPHGEEEEDEGRGPDGTERAWTHPLLSTRESYHAGPSHRDPIIPSAYRQLYRSNAGKSSTLYSTMRFSAPSSWFTRPEGVFHRHPCLNAHACRYPTGSHKSQLSDCLCKTKRICIASAVTSKSLSCFLIKICTQ